MTGPSVVVRPPTVDREGVEGSASTTEVRRSPAVPAIFSSWRVAFRYLSVWAGAGLLVYAALFVGWLIVT